MELFTKKIEPSLVLPKTLSPLAGMPVGQYQLFTFPLASEAVLPDNRIVLLLSPTHFRSYPPLPFPPCVLERVMGTVFAKRACLLVWTGLKNWVPTSLIHALYKDKQTYWIVKGVGNSYSKTFLCEMQNICSHPHQVIAYNTSTLLETLADDYLVATTCKR